MIIEKAFFDTCFQIIDTCISEETNEEHLRGLMQQSIYEQYRNNYWNTSQILPQCKYDLDKRKLCDLKVKLPGMVQLNYEPYCIFPVNWVEIKYFKKWNQKNIINDLIRLCLLPKELQGKIKKNGRYFMLVQNSFLSKNENNPLKKLFNPGQNRIKINNKNNYSLDLKSYTYEFIPFYKPKTKNCFFSGYLIKILEFKFQQLKEKLIITSKQNTRFEEKDIILQKKFAENINTFIQK